MTPNEFERIVSADPALSAPVRSAAAAMPHSRETFGAPGELVAIAALLPVVTVVVKGVGLPWLYEAKRYTDIWRLKFHKWVDTQYRKHGLDPDAAEAAGEARREGVLAAARRPAQRRRTRRERGRLV